MQATVIGIQTTGAQQNGSSADSQKLVKSAREFEAILLQGWLEKMNQSFLGLEKSQDAAHDTISSLGTQAIAKAWAARGGIGIASMIVKQLQPKETADGSGARRLRAEATSQLAPQTRVEQAAPGNIKASSPIADHSIARQ